MKHINNSRIIAFIFVISAVLLNVQAINKNFLAKDKKKAVTNVTGQNVLGVNKKRNYLQGPSFVQQYIDNPKLDEFNDKTYGKSDFYLWDEGVTALAYDDFFEGKTKFITNLEYLGAGYNIAYANPNPLQGIDPGYRTNNAFKFELDSTPRKALSADGGYFVPEGVNLLSKTSCIISYSSQDISNIEDYSSSLSKSFGLSVKIPFFSFKASKQYQETENEFKSQDTSIITTTADCLVHKLDVDRYNQPTWSDSLYAALDYISNHDTEEEAWEFFEHFGTHVTIGVELGAKYGYEFVMKKSKVESMKSRGENVEMAASVMGNGGSVESQSANNSYNSFKDAMKSWKQITIGAPPVSGNDPAEWAQNINESPMPVSGKFIPWSEFLLEYSQNNKLTLSGSKIQQLSTLFQKALENYCSGYLEPNRLVQSCTQSQGAFKDGQYNVPGGVLYPGINYNKQGGNIGYHWEDIGQKCQDVAADTDGSIWCARINDGNKDNKENNKIMRYDIKTQKWEENGPIIGKRIDVQNGRVIVVGTNNCVYFRDTKAKAEWGSLGIDQCNMIDVCVDEQAIMWTLNQDGKTSMFTDPSQSKGNSTRKRSYISCSDGKILQYSTSEEYTKEYIYDYNKNKWEEEQQLNTVLLENTKLKDGCITQGKWAYKIQEHKDDNLNNKIYFTQDVTNYNEYGNKDVDGKAQRIACASTATGPVIAIVDEKNNTLIRMANKD